MNPELKAGILGKRDIFINNIVKRKADVGDRVEEFKKHPHDVQKKILISLGLGTAVLTTNWIGIPTYVLNESARIQGLLPIPIDNFAALIASYGINAGFFLVNLNQERRSLQNVNLEMNQDLSSTVIYHGLGKKEFWKKRPTGRSITAISAPTIISAVITSLVRESAFITIASVSPERMPQVVLMKSIQGFFNLGQSAVTEAILRIVGKNKRFENHAQELLYKNGYDKSGCFIGVENDTLKTSEKKKPKNYTQELLFANENL